MTQKERIGIVGTGRMGANMALRLHECGYPISVVYDRTKAHAEQVANASGATVASTLAEVSANADVIITVVSDDAAMHDIFMLGTDSLLHGSQGKLFVNCATVTPSVHVKIEAAAQRAGAQSLEACMASSITQARAGTLYLMLGGSSAAFDRAKPVLDTLASRVRYVGAAGKAAQVKALVNMVMNANTVALAEGLGLGDALGLDLTMLREIFAQTGANSRVLETDGADMQMREHDVYFSAAHAAKDSSIALALGEEVGLHLPLARATFDQYERMKVLGLGELDKSGVAELTFLARHAKDVR